jgi:hypothetical protein
MANIVYCSSNDLCKNNYYHALSTPSSCNPTHLPSAHTGITNSSTSRFYFAPSTPVANLNPKAPSIGVRVANSLPERSIASPTLASVLSLPPAAMQGHVMPSFPHTLIGLGPFADLGCTIVFTKTAVNVIDPDGQSILEGWREQDGPQLWHFPLKANKPSLPVTASLKNNEELGPRVSAANFSLPPPATPIQCPASPLPSPPPPTMVPPPTPSPIHRWYLQCAICIPAKASRPPAQTGKPAQSYTFTGPLKPWPWWPRRPALRSTPATWIYQVLAPWLDSTMHVLDSQSSRHGSRPSRQATATHLMGSPIPMCPNTVRTPTKPSWDIWPSNVRMSGQLSPSQILLWPLCPSVSHLQQWTHLPIKSSSRSTPSAGSTQTTQVVSQSRRALATNM